MAFNRELYFTIKSIKIIIASAYLTMTLVIRGDGSQDYSQLLLMMIVVHSLDIIGYILDFMGFIMKDFKYYVVKCIIDVPSIVFNLAV